MPTRTSTAKWQGDLKSGTGELALGSGVFSGPYSFPTRFENAPGTNPEELIAAAIAGCYSMALSHALASAGKNPNWVDTSADVHLTVGEGGPSINRIDLKTRGDVPGVDAAEFAKFAEETKTGCIVSRALAAVEITLDAALV